MALCGGGCGCGKGWPERRCLQSAQDAAGLGRSERLLLFPERAEGKGSSSSPGSSALCRMTWRGPYCSSIASLHAAIAPLHAATAALPCSSCTILDKPSLAANAAEGGTAWAGGSGVGCSVSFRPLKHTVGWWRLGWWGPGKAAGGGGGVAGCWECPSCWKQVLTGEPWGGIGCF